MKIYNTMTRKKEQFKFINQNKIKLFVCGPTVYDESHIGHARTYISFDIVARYLKFKGVSVFYLQNITDIDDKIINRAAEIDQNPIELARRFEKKYLADMKVLGVKNVNLYARATEHVPEIINQIKTLIDKGFAYETKTGIYFDESRFPEFGRLSGRKVDDLNIHRVSSDPSKRSPGDFALWKKRDEKPYWNSPWGNGRPGWHIEDTAITEEYLGPRYDIHGGGLDLIFPHHEAEIAQMESASGEKPMVRYWMHTGFLNVEGEKMSKSLGNFITIKDLLQDYSPDVFRFFVLSTHYRSTIDFSKSTLEQSKNSLERISKLVETMNNLDDVSESTDYDNYYEDQLKKFKIKFFEAMDNDFNTPHALATLFNYIREVNKALDDNKISKQVSKSILNFLKDIETIFGLDFKSDALDDRTNELLDVIIGVREELRKKKDWELADLIRSKLKDLNIILEDK